MTQRLWAIRWLFATLGLVFGTWAVRIPDVAKDAHVSSGSLGLVLFAIAIGSLIGMPLSSALVARWATSKVALWLAGSLAICAFVLASMPNLVALLAGAVLFGTINGCYGVIINTLATHTEADLGRKITSSCHACFSLATLTASLLGGLLVNVLTPGIHLATVGATCTLIAVLLGHGVKDNAAVTSSSRTFPHSRVVWLAALLAFMALLAEGVVTDWSAYFMQHEILGKPGSAQTWGYAGFSVSMASGRSLGDWLSRKFSQGPLLFSSLLLALSGYAIVVASTSTPIAVAGFTLIGLGLSNLYPSMISLASAGVSRNEVHTAVAAVSTIGYFGFLLGPALIGGIAALTSVRLAFTAPLLCLVLGCFFATLLMKTTKRIK